MNRESWFWVGVAILAILALGAIVVVASDDEGSTDTDMPPGALDEEVPMEDTGSDEGTDLDMTPEQGDVGASTGS